MNTYYEIIGTIDGKAEILNGSFDKGDCVYVGSGKGAMERRRLQGAENSIERDKRGIEIAEEDTTCGGNCGNRILSWEWGILAENPSKEQIKSFTN